MGCCDTRQHTSRGRTSSFRKHRQVDDMTGTTASPCSTASGRNEHSRVLHRSTCLAPSRSSASPSPRRLYGEPTCTSDSSLSQSVLGGISLMEHRSGVGARQPSRGTEEPLNFQDNMSLAEVSGVQPLAHGGFCVVCTCVYRGRRAVLKVPRPRGPEGAAQDLLTEIAIYRRISTVGGHVNVVRAYGAGFHIQNGEQVPFLVLEHLHGGTLADALERSRPPDGVWSHPLPRLPVALAVANALAYLHNDAVPGGFVLHRDLKPTNIGLCGNGHVKVFDLGLSALRECRHESDNKYQMSGMAGSKRFMAPEVCSGLPYNEKVDVYSFAVVLWEICALRKPFAGMSVAEHSREVIQGGMRPPLDPNWPPVLGRLMQACWHENPDRRPSMVEARDMLQNIIVMTTYDNS